VAKSLNIRGYDGRIQGTGLVQRMLDRAKELNADAVVGIRFQTSMIMQGSAELLVYGTAVKLAQNE